MDRLAVLPKPITTEPSSYILSLITAFCQDIRLNVHGDPGCAELVQANRQIYTTYKHDIRSSAPQFLPFVDASEMSSGGIEWLDIDDEDQQGDGGVCTQSLNLSPGNYVFLSDVKQHIDKFVF